MPLGHWQEMKAIGQAKGALAALAELLPDTAERERDGEVEKVTVAELVLGDVVLVRPGRRVPADGVVFGGGASFDEAMITGESRPTCRNDGDRVVAATVSTDSAVRIRIDALGDDTALAGIQRMVEDAQASGSRTQALADRAAAALVYLATSAAIVTTVVWALLGDADEGVISTPT